jgi:uridine kinase
LERKKRDRAEAMGRTSIIALSGPSSSGKTTLARLLQRIFAHLNMKSERGQAQALPISTFIIHEDDFYHPDDKYLSPIHYAVKYITDEMQDPLHDHKIRPAHPRLGLRRGP